MSLYGIAFYGIDKYGASTTVEFDASPFVAEPEGYDRIALSWASPSGTWDTLRVLRNSTGFPVDELDGEVVAEFTAPAMSALDMYVRPGAWHYYAIWVHSASGWSRAAIATVLMVKDHAYSERLFDALPRYHQHVSGVLDDGEAVVNETLQHFMQVLGYGLDYIKTYYDSLRLLNDPMRNHLFELLSLAGQLGVEWVAATPSALFRSRVQNAGTLARQKGVTEHIRSVVGMTVGWDVEIRPGANLMLNEDSASFAHPDYDTWDAARNYAATERVSYNGYLYAAKTGGAYGESQKPSGSPTTNTWWTYVSAVTDAGLLSSDGALFGWGIKGFSGTNPAPASLAQGIGMPSPWNASVQGKNSIYFKNGTASTADFGVTSVLATTPEDAVRRGVPVPAVRDDWDATVDYEAGTLVRYNRIPFRAKRRNKGVAPRTGGVDAAEWEAIGVDERVRITGSLHVKGGDTGGAQALTAFPVMDFYSDKGVLINTLDTSLTLTPNLFDSFDTRAGLLSGRALDQGAPTWSVVNSWAVTDSGVAYPSVPTTSAVALIAGGTADGRVAVTFAAGAYGALKQGLVIRWTGGANNNLTTATFIKATRTALYSTAAGVDTLLGTYSTACSDGDRIAVSFVGTALKVYRNGVQVLATTSSTNTTATTHGILVS